MLHHMKEVYLVGESWVSNATHFKRWEQFIRKTFHIGAEKLVSSIDAYKFKIK